MIAATMFSGIGAPECAMPGWDWRWHAEIEPFPSAVMKTRHPESANLGDVNDPDFCEKAEACGRPNIIIFGSPCQDFSVAGRRVGLDGARGNLAIVALGIIRRLRPRWFLFENVPGLLSSFSGSAGTIRTLYNRISTRNGFEGDYIDCREDSDFAAFLAAIRECGYLGCYRILDAQYARVPQRRRRIFFVGYLGDWRPPFAELFDPDSLLGNPPPRREAGKRVAPTLDARTDGGGAGWGTDFLAGGGLAAGDEGPRLDLQGLRGNERPGGMAGLPVVRAETGGNLNPEIAWALQERDAKGADSSTKDGHLIVQAFNTGQGWWDKAEQSQAIRKGDDNGGGGARESTLVAFSCKDYGNDCTEDLAPPLRAMNDVDGNQNAGGQLAVAFKPSHYTRGKDGAPSDIASPLTVETDKGDQDQVLLASHAVRRLTPVECERLQGFEDGYTAVPYRGKPAADGPRYKALGNAMNVAELKWILGRIEQFEREVR